MTDHPSFPAEQRNAEIDRALSVAIELDAAERDSYLAGVRARDPALADAVGRLLAELADPDPRLDPERWRGRPLRMYSDAPAQRDGERVGPYRIVKELGRGGMSVVYLAERADGLYDQQVALKFLGISHEFGVRRFAQERRILAALDHSRIARLLDGGADALGRPYIVMEYVEGWSLDEYCTRSNAAIARRIDLVCQVADALEYAHRNLVVHRDIKPSNIMVTDDGRVKLLDFGIAKLLASGDAEGSAVATQTMVRLLTPEYASPEQVRGERIGTASDVYQLGVVLYELLSGQRPFSLGNATASEIERAVCHQEPQPPSTAAVKAEGAAQSREERVALGRRLRGDLDSIVLKALAKEPGLRYASVGELRDDLLRYREGVPIRARQHTRLYRAAKFVRRHRMAVAVSALLVALLGAYAVTITLHSRRVAAEAARTERVMEILASVFTAANPGVSRGEEPTASELLESGARRVRAELGHQPDIQAEMMTLLGGVYVTLGRYDDAALLVEDALAVRRRILRPNDPKLAHTTQLLGQIRHVQGRLTDAEELLREAVTIGTRIHGERSWQVADALDELGDLLHTRGDMVEAATVLTRAVAIHRARGSDAPTAARNLANVHRDRGAYASADSLYRGSLAASESRFGTSDPISALTRSELSVLLAETGRHAEAESLLHVNRGVYESLYPDGHAMMGTTVRNLGLVRLRQQRYADANDLFLHALTVYRNTLGEESSLVPRVQRYLAEVLLELGDAGAARELASAAAERMRALGIHSHPAIADALEVEGRAALALGSAEEAARLLTAALEMRERLSIAADPRIHVTQGHLRAALAAR